MLTKSHVLVRAFRRKKKNQNTVRAFWPVRKKINNNNNKRNARTKVHAFQVWTIRNALSVNKKKGNTCSGEGRELWVGSRCRHCCCCCCVAAAVAAAPAEAAATAAATSAAAGAAATAAVAAAVAAGTTAAAAACSTIDRTCVQMLNEKGGCQHSPKNYNEGYPLL